VPVVGELFDVVNGILYLTEGDIGNALISFASMIPVAGVAIVGVGRIGLKAAGNVIDAVSSGVRVSDVVPSVRPSSATVIPAIRASDAGKYTVYSPQAGVGQRTLDQAVNPDAPRAIPWEARPVGLSRTQNDFVQARVAELEDRFQALDIRINQQQVDINGVRVGVNRPDVQYTFNGVRYYEEFDTAASRRGPGHGARIAANDPLGVTVLWNVN
jgi:hypothetical protein